MNLNRISKQKCFDLYCLKGNIKTMKTVKEKYLVVGADFAGYL